MRRAWRKSRRTITGPLTVAENPHPHLINHEYFQLLSFLFAETIDNLVSITLFGIDAMMLELVKGTTKMEVRRAIQVATDQEFVLGGRSDRSAAVVDGSLVPFDGLRCLCSVGIRLPVQVWHLRCTSQFSFVVGRAKKTYKKYSYILAHGLYQVRSKTRYSGLVNLDWRLIPGFWPPCGTCLGVSV
jgi:hypothetical protein